MMAKHCWSSLQASRQLVKLSIILQVVLHQSSPGCLGQSNAGVYDFGLSRAGERRGSWTPSEWMAVVLVAMTICLGLAVSIGLCFYVRRRQTQRKPPVATPYAAYMTAGYTNPGDGSMIARL